VTRVRGTGVNPTVAAMDLPSEPTDSNKQDPRTATAQRERRLEQLIDRLPRRLRSVVRWLRRPSSRWVRIPAGLLLIGGSFLSILPVFGLWMLPLGLVLLAEDVTPLRRARDRVLDWIARRRPHWLRGPSS
jgi:hypothetical protein